MEPEELTELRDRVKLALATIPNGFHSELSLAGVPATDLCGAQSLIAAGVEREVADRLNDMRMLWDPDGKYMDCKFQRFPESYPDVRLIRPGIPEPLIGVELKTWYLLSKEQEPCARFTASVNASTDYDLLVIFPWYWDRVITGVPALLSPWVRSAKEVAEIRNEAWGEPVQLARTTPYPAPRSKYCDVPMWEPAATAWGRIARIPGLMDDFVKSSLDTDLYGIPAHYWVSFLSLFKEKAASDAIKRGLERIATEVNGDDSLLVGAADASMIADYLFAITRILRD